MAVARAIGLYDASGAPASGAAPSCVVQAWEAATLASRAAPPLVEVAAGVYEVRPTDRDELDGVVVLVDAGAAITPRFAVVEVSRQNRTNQFLAWCLVDEATGELWGGAAPDWADWSGQSAPSITSPVDGVYVACPSAEDMSLGAAGRIDAPAGAAPAHLVAAVAWTPYVVGPGVSTTPAEIMAAAAVVVAQLGTVFSAGAQAWAHVRDLPFTSPAVGRAESFALEAQEHRVTNAFGVSGSRESEFEMVVRLGMPAYEYNYDRQRVVQNDVGRIIDALEAQEWLPGGAQLCVLVQPASTDRATTPEWWETDVVFRVVYLSTIHPGAHP